MNEKYILGVDVGGSHISAAFVDLISGNVALNSYAEEKVDPTLSPDKLLDAWTRFLSRQMSTIHMNSVGGIGIGIPGEFDYENGIALYDQNKFTQLHGINIKQYLEHALKLENRVPIKFINDASAFALGEFWRGAARGYARVLMLTFGTGLGATFLQDGEIMKEGEGIPENGTLYEKSFKCGIADEYFSTRYFIREYFNKTGIKLSNAKELSELARKADVIAVNIFKEFGHNLAVFLREHVVYAKTQAVVLGGNIALSYELFQQTLESGLSDLTIDFRLASLGAFAPVIGSASLFR